MISKEIRMLRSRFTDVRLTNCGTEKTLSGKVNKPTEKLFRLLALTNTLTEKQLDQIIEEARKMGGVLHGGE